MTCIHPWYIDGMYIYIYMSISTLSTMTCTHVTSMIHWWYICQSQIPTLNFLVMEIETNITGWQAQLSLQANILCWKCSSIIHLPCVIASSITLTAKFCVWIEFYMVKNLNYYIMESTLWQYCFIPKSAALYCAPEFSGLRRLCPNNINNRNSHSQTSLCSCSPWKTLLKALLPWLALEWCIFNPSFLTSRFFIQCLLAFKLSSRHWFFFPPLLGTFDQSTYIGLMTV